MVPLSQRWAVEVKSYFKLHEDCYLNFLINMIFDIPYEVIIDRFSSCSVMIRHAGLFLSRIVVFYVVYMVSV